MMKATKPPFTWRSITESRLLFPLTALLLILLFDLIFIPGFFAIENRDGDLRGSLIDIFRNGSTVMLLAIGMTLVIATGGVDLSVGAVMAISASVAGILMNPSALRNEVFFVTDPYYTFQPLWVVIVSALVVAIICGLWNGVLVAYMRIQPMVATLILMISGRGIAVCQRAFGDVCLAARHQFQHRNAGAWSGCRNMAEDNTAAISRYPRNGRASPLSSRLRRGT